MGAQRSEGGRDWQEQEEAENPEKITRPWNLMIKHRHIHKRGRRSLSAVSYTDPHVSMDLLRAVLQPSFNNDIMAVFMKYQKFYEKAAENVKENVGMEVQTDHLIREAYRNALEHAKQLFPENEVKTAGPGRLPKASDEEGSQRGSSFPRKRKSRPTVAFSDRPTTYIPVKPKIEAIRREGPKWDPSRLSETTTFVLGSRANKALGMGGTRGRIYIKHADLFKYAADSKDKQWLAERHHMRATGGKMAYLLVEEDIQELSCSDEYRRNDSKAGGAFIFPRDSVRWEHTGSLDIELPLGTHIQIPSGAPSPDTIVLIMDGSAISCTWWLQMKMENRAADMLRRRNEAYPSPTNGVTRVNLCFSNIRKRFTSLSYVHEVFTE